MAESRRTGLERRRSWRTDPGDRSSRQRRSACRRQFRPPCVPIFDCGFGRIFPRRINQCVLRTVSARSATLRKLADTGASGVGSESTQKSPSPLTGMTVSAALITSSAVRITVITQRLGVSSVALEPKLNYRAKPFWPRAGMPLCSFTRPARAPSRGNPQILYRTTLRGFDFTSKSLSDSVHVERILGCGILQNSPDFRLRPSFRLCSVDRLGDALRQLMHCA
jgi:hypothetical protein